MRTYLIICILSVSAITLISGCNGLVEPTPSLDVLPTPDVSEPIPPYGAVPSPQQLAWQQMEQNLFIHFGINTFTGREWGDGTEDPVLFRPKNPDPKQWAQVAKEAGFNGIVFTAKHHEGFALWPTEHSDFSIARSPWYDENGRDIIKELAEACRETGLKLGLYFSPWDRYEPTYGTLEYNDFFVAQLVELLTNYGPLFEIWFDGAGEGKASHLYDLKRYHSIVREYQPDALIAVVGPDIRWVGNENGIAPQPLWSAENDTWWYPYECDVSIRPGWFWRAREDQSVKSLDELLDIYYNSVGKNCVLLLNVPVNQEGVIPEPDVQRLMEWRKVLDETFEENLALTGIASAGNTREGRETWAPQNAIDGKKTTFWATDDSVRTATLEIDLRQKVRFNVIELAEPIQYGQRIAAYRVEVWTGKIWRKVARGTTIGYKRLHRLNPVRTDRVRIVIEESRANPALQDFSLYEAKGQGIPRDY